jgi:hypothetical protein
MEEIVTVDGKQFKLTVDRPLTATEKANVMADIKKQSCGTCGPRGTPRTMAAGLGRMRSLDVGLSCFEGMKSSGDDVTLKASPDGAVGPYFVRFWRKSAPGAYAEIGGGPITVNEGSNTSYTFELTDSDLTGAVGDATAGAPIVDDEPSTGEITDPENSNATFGAGILRVATTTYDSCPTGARGCVEYCDVSLACVAPTCNFVVT